MPTDWVTISGVLTSLTGGVDVGYTYTPYSKYAGKTAGDILKQVDKVLQSTNTVLENHRDLIPPQDFQELKRNYCRYHWQMTNESQEDRATTDNLIRQSRILSQLYAKRRPHVERARDLLRQVETYQTRVLAASRNAQLPDTLVLFDDEIDEAALEKPEPVTTAPANQSYTSWFSAFGTAGRSDSTSTVESQPAKAGSDATTSYEAEGHKFVISVTHFPKPKFEAMNEDQSIVGTGGNIYRRMISFENAFKRIEIVDSKLYALDSNEAYISEEALRAMSDLGQSLLNQPDSAIQEGAQIIPESQASPPLEATIQQFKNMSMEVSK